MRLNRTRFLAAVAATVAFPYRVAAAQSDAEFVTRVYFIAFERQPTSAESADATKALAGGTPRATFVTQLVRSEAFEAREADWLTEHFLKRAAGSADVAIVKTGATPSAAVAAIVGSDDYAKLHVADPDWADAFWRDVFLAEPTAEQSSLILAGLGTGRSRGGVALTFLSADAQRPKVLQLLYNGMLHQTGAPQGASLAEAIVGAAQGTAPPSG